MNSQLKKVGVVIGLAVVFVMPLSSPGFAGFRIAGYDLQVVQSGQDIANGAVSFQVNPVWVGGTPEKPYSFDTTFTLPVADEIVFARMYVNIWGGTNTNTCQIDTLVNDVALDVVHIGGTEDSNPVYDPNRTCVYGSGYGTWQVAYSGVAEALNLDSTANEVVVTISDPTGQFDGRTVDVVLATVYRDSAIQQVLDYYLAEADGYMRRSPGTPGSPTDRILEINSIDTSDVVEAAYTAHYTHGTSGQFDAVYFNDTAFGGEDVAVGAMGTYGPDVLTFDVTNLLAAETTVRYSVDETVVGSPSEFSLRAKTGLLEIIRPYCIARPVGDINADCRVNLEDLALLASGWLDCNLVPETACRQ